MSWTDCGFTSPGLLLCHHRRELALASPDYLHRLKNNFEMTRRLPSRPMGFHQPPRFRQVSLRVPAAVDFLVCRIEPGWLRSRCGHECEPGVSAQCPKCCQEGRC